MTKPQHGRKPQKPWHRRNDARKLRKADRRWPKDTPAVEYDGAPMPLRQKRQRGKSRGMDDA